MTDWNKRFIELAIHVSKWSKDRSTGTGAVITTQNNRILSVGYNGFPSGCNDTIERRHKRPAKYLYTEHAERNAIYNCARNGIDTSGCTMYLMWFPCADCARAIIQSNIETLVCFKPEMNNKNWGDSFEVASEILLEAGVDIQFLDKDKYL